jgi:hypothetical protein
MRDVDAGVGTVFLQDLSQGLLDLLGCSQLRLFSLQHFPLEVVEGVQHVVEKLCRSEVDADSFGNSLKVMVFSLSFPHFIGRTAFGAFYPFAELYAAFEEDSDKLIDLSEFENAVIIDLENDLFLTYLLEVLDEDAVGAVSWQAFGEDDVGVVRVVLSFVEGVVVVLEVVALVDGLED